MIPTLVLHNKAMHLGQLALDKYFTDGLCDKADDWVAAMFILLQIDDEIRSCLALTFNATIADTVILEELDLDNISLPQDDAHMVDFAVDHILHNFGSMSVDGGENLCSVPLVIFDLVKADGVGVKIGATEDEVSRHKQQCLLFVHDLFGCWSVLLIGMRGNPVILSSGKEDYCTAEVPWTSYILVDWPLVLSTLLGRSLAKGIITDLLNVLGGRAGVRDGRSKRVTPDLFNQFFQLQRVTGAALRGRIKHQISWWGGR